MEGSESEAVFGSLNLNPQLFINETLNTVDHLVDDAFHFYHQSASTLLNADAARSSQIPNLLPRVLIAFAVRYSQIWNCAWVYGRNIVFITVLQFPRISLCPKLCVLSDNQLVVSFG